MWPELFVPGLFALGFAILGGLLWFGRGARLIAGYNTIPARERGRIDERKLCRATACYVWLVGLLIAASVWNKLFLAVGMPVCTVAFIVWGNTGRRVEKPPQR